MSQVCAAKVIEVVQWENVDTDTTETRFCYVIGCFTTGRAKIGITDDFKRRFKEIQMRSPTKLFLAHVAVTVGMELEQFLFKKFAKYRVHGEWFDFQGDDASMASMDDVFHEYYDATDHEYLWWDDDERAEWKKRNNIQEEAAA